MNTTAALLDLQAMDKGGYIYHVIEDEDLASWCYRHWTEARHYGVLREIPLRNVVPCQDNVFTEGVAYWIENIEEAADDLGELPAGVRLSDSDTVYLLNGHHRRMAHMLLGIESMPICVLDVKETYLSLREIA